MNSFGSTFLLFTNEVSNLMIERKTFNAEWFHSPEGQRRMEQSFDEGLPMKIAILELELWCKGWVKRKSLECANPLRLAKSITTI